MTNQFAESHKPDADNGGNDVDEEKDHTCEAKAIEEEKRERKLLEALEKKKHQQHRIHELHAQRLQFEKEVLLEKLKIDQQIREQEEEIKSLQTKVASSHVPTEEATPSDITINQPTNPAMGTYGSIPSSMSTPHPRVKGLHPSWDSSEIHTSFNNSWIEATQAMCQAMNETQAQTRAMMRAAEVPVKLENFDGNPLHYCRFINRLDLAVDYNEVEARHKFAVLLQSCIGEAKSALSMCESIHDPEMAYAEARRTIRERFGDEYTKSQAFLKQVRYHPTIMGDKDLRKFADQVHNTAYTLKNLGYEKEMGTQQNLLEIVQKLPGRYKGRWLTKVQSIREKNKIPQLEYVVTLLQLVAAEANDTVYGHIFKETISTKNKKHSLHKGTKDRGSYAVETTSAKASFHKPKCLMCGQEHPIWRCQQFRAISVSARRDLVLSNMRCLNCYGSGHSAQGCLSQFRCKVPGCGEKHSTFLHPVQHPQTSPPQSATHEAPVAQTVAPVGVTDASQAMSSVSSSYAGKKSKVILPIVPVGVIGTNNMESVYIDTYALLDTGTNQSFCSEKIANLQQVPMRPETYLLTTLERKDQEVRGFAVSLEVCDIEENNFHIMHHVSARPSINVNLSNKARTEDLREWSHLSDLVLPEVECDKVDLVIGGDNPDMLVPNDVRSGGKGDPYAVLTPFGWNVNGPIYQEISPQATSCFIGSDKTLPQQVEEFMELDRFAGDNSEDSISMDDKHVLTIWDRHTKVQEGHYQTVIPFRNQPPHLPNNKTMAESRLKLLGRRLLRNEPLREMYIQEITNLIVKGYAEPVPTDQLQRRDGYVWYLPHHPVIHPRKPGKVRIVFDCVAKYNGIALNDTVFQGPDLMNKLVGVLLRFRQEPIALIADIEGMFHQVRVVPEHRDVLRLLWWANNDLTQQPIEFRMTAHLFGGVWSPSCANFALRMCASDNSQDFDDGTITTVRRNFYVDDCLKSIPTVQAACLLVQQLTELLRRGGFRLTKWISNNREVLETIPEKEHAKELAFIDLDNNALPAERALGVLWRVEDDSFGFQIGLQNQPMTKRGMLSISSAVFDPLGFVSPFIVKAKLLFQQLCKLGCGWDENMPKEIEQQWALWVENLPYVQELTIPRCIKPL